MFMVSPAASGRENAARQARDLVLGTFFEGGRRLAAMAASGDRAS
jgi:hypothetical protein